MNPTTGQLLQSGLVITALGMGLVFASLVLLWGLLRLLTSIFQDRLEPASESAPAVEQTALVDWRAAAADAAPEAAALTVERARVAAVVAGAILANALPIRIATLTESHGGQGRAAPAWLSGSLPPRAAGQSHDPGKDQV